MTTDTDKLVETALNDAYEKGWCAAAQWANRDDLRHDTGSIAYEGQRDAILSGNAAGLVASLCADVEPFVFEEYPYHYEAMGCGLEDRNITDRYEAMAYGWERAMERAAEAIPDDLYPASTVASLTAQRDAALSRVAELEKDAQDRLDTVQAIFDAIGYTKEYAMQWPKEKASVTFKRWFDEQMRAALTKGQPAQHPQQEQSND